MAAADEAQTVPDDAPRDEAPRDEAMRDEAPRDDGPAGAPSVLGDTAALPNPPARFTVDGPRAEPPDTVLPLSTRSDDEATDAPAPAAAADDAAAASSLRPDDVAVSLDGESNRDGAQISVDLPIRHADEASSVDGGAALRRKGGAAQFNGGDADPIRAPEPHT